MIKVTCEQCNGDGYVDLVEDGVVFDHACYRCGTDGYHLMTDEQYCEYVNDMIADALEAEAWDPYNVHE